MCLLPRKPKLQPFTLWKPVRVMLISSEIVPDSFLKPPSQCPPSMLLEHFWSEPITDPEMPPSQAVMLVSITTKKMIRKYLFILFSQTDKLEPAVSFFIMISHLDIFLRVLVSFQNSGCQTSEVYEKPPELGMCL